MILDAQQQFSDGQALTATAVSTNVIDLGPISPNTRRDIGTGEPMAILLTVGTAADFTTGDETYAFNLQTDDAEGFGSPVSVVQWTVLAAKLTAGAVIALPIPNVQVERFIRLQYVLGGTTPSVTLDAYLQPLKLVQSYVSYADNSTISG